MTKKLLTKEEIIQEIKNYSPHTERLTFSTLMALNQKIHILNISPSGYGKTRATAELLKLLKIPHTFVAGHISPMAFFEILKKDGIIIVDEGADLLSNNTVINLLLNALWNGYVEWTNNNKSLQHNFKGLIIFNTNTSSNTPLMNALKDRVFTNEITLTSEQIKEKIQSGKDYKPNMKIWVEIKEKLNTKTEVSEVKKEKNKLYTLIENQDPKSMRDFWRLQKIASFSLSLLGNLDLIEYFEEVDEIWKVFNSKIKRSEKVKKIAEIKCITERQARDIIIKFEQGKV